MAKERVFRVVIDGEEYVSKAAGEAEKGMDKFVGKKDKWFKSFVDLKAAWDVVAGAARALHGVAMESLAAFDEYDNSMRKLQGTAKITGTPLAVLTELAAHGKREFALSSVQANEYATSVNNLASKAGFAGDKQALLAAMLDLGAAKGLTAAESLQRFQQSILGLDEGTDVLFGKNPSALWADYAEQIGKSPGKMSDLEKSLVLVYATMEAGGKVQGSYSEWVKSSAGQTAILSNRLADARVAFGGILSPIRAVVVEGINTFIDSLGDGKESLAQMREALTLIAKNLMGAFLSAWQTLGPTVVTILKATVAGVMLFGDAFRALVIGVQKGVGEIVNGIGWLVQKGGGILEKFGVTIVGDWGDTMREWGRKTSDQADESWGKFRRESTAAWASVTGDAQRGAQAAAAPIQQLGATGEAEMGKVATASAKAGKAIADNLGPTVQDLLGVTEQSMKDLAKTADMTLEPTKAQAFNGQMGHLITKAHEVRDRLMGWTPEIEKAEGTARDMSREVGTLARGALDAAQAFGVMDAEAASMLNSVVNVAAALPRALGGDLSALGGVIGGVANIASKIVGGDAQRQKNLVDNTRNLDRLTREVSGLRLGVTGEQFAGVGGALGAIEGMLKKGFAFDGFGADALRDELTKRGLTFNDLDAVAKALGFNIRDSKGNLDGAALGQLFRGMDMDSPTSIGNSFSDKLDQMLKGFDVRGTGGMAQLSNLFGLGTSSGASILSGIFNPSDLAGTRAGLLGIFDALERGEIDPSQIGGLTGAQFRDFIIDLIGRVDTLSDAPAGETPSATAPLPGGEEVPVGTSPTPSPTLTLADVFREYRDVSVPLLTQQLDMQLRIAEATEATAENTSLTAMEVRALREALLSGTFIDNVDRALADRRREAELTRGTGITL